MGYLGRLYSITLNIKKLVNGRVISHSKEKAYNNKNHSGSFESWSKREYCR